MSKNQQLCYNCIYSGSCFKESQAKEPILSCNEYFKASSYEKPFISYSHQTETTNQLGLCTSCDHKKNCTLRDKNKIILNCEYYQ